jgi:hypothetical protein
MATEKVPPVVPPVVPSEKLSAESIAADINSQAVENTEKIPETKTSKIPEPESEPERNYIVMENILHNEREYRRGDSLSLTDEQAKPLLKYGAIQ